MISLMGLVISDTFWSIRIGSFVDWFLLIVVTIRKFLSFNNLCVLENTCLPGCAEIKSTMSFQAVKPYPCRS